MFKKHRLKIAIAFSLFIHFLSAGVISIRNSKPLVQHHFVDIQMIESQLKKASSTDKHLGQIVEQNEKPINDEIPEDAKFLSKNNQKVEKQTKAENSGKFKNTAGFAKPSEEIAKNPDSPQAQAKIKSEEKPDHLDQDKNLQKKLAKSANQKLVTTKFGEQALPKIFDLKPEFKPDPKAFVGGDLQGADASATDDHIKDIKPGVQTLLSTREFVYYTYYNRIKARLRQYWEPMIKVKVSNILRQGRTIASTSEKITKIVIVLNEQGTLEKVQVIGPSGMTDLDDAAVEAFRAAAPFPNPPKGIIEEDGKIRIRWDFILEALGEAYLEVENV